MEQPEARYQLSPEHLPASLPSKHSYCVTLVQPLCGFHRHEGSPLGMSFHSLATCDMSALDFSGRFLADPCSGIAWMGAKRFQAKLFLMQSHFAGSHHAPG